MAKSKVRVLPRIDMRAPSGNSRKEINDEHVNEEDLYMLIEGAGWTDNPGDGKAVLLPDGREVLNPIPFAPPIGFVEKPSVIDQVMAKLNARRVMQLQDDEEIDLRAELDDFEVDEDFDPRSVYEVTMQDEHPDLPQVPVDPPAPPAPPAPPVPPAPPAPPAPSVPPPPVRGGENET